MANAENAKKPFAGERRIRSGFFLRKRIGNQTRYFGGSWEEKYMFVDPNNIYGHYFRWVPVRFVDPPKKNK